MRSKAVVLLMLICCFVCYPLVVGILCYFLFSYALLCVCSSFAIILKRKRELVTLLLLFYGCLVTVNNMWLFLTVPPIGLRCVIMVLPYHNHILFERSVEYWRAYTCLTVPNSLIILMWIKAQRCLIRMNEL